MRALNLGSLTRHTHHWTDVALTHQDSPRNSAQRARIVFLQPFVATCQYKDGCFGPRMQRWQV